LDNRLVIENGLLITLHKTSGYPSTACYHCFIGTVPPLSHPLI